MSNESPTRRKSCHQTFNLVVWLKTSYSCKKLCHNEDDLGENFLLLQEGCLTMKTSNFYKRLCGWRLITRMRLRVHCLLRTPSYTRWFYNDNDGLGEDQWWNFWRIPAGVPVMMISPGWSLNRRDSSAIISSTWAIVTVTGFEESLIVLDNYCTVK